MRTGIFFDTFLQGGGAEKIIEVLAEELNADIITSGFNENLYNERIKDKVKDIGNSFYGINNRLGFFETAFRFYFNRKEFDYDFYIFGGIFSIFAAKGNTPNCWFCFSPNRTLYDLKEKRIGESGVIGKAILQAYTNTLKPIDQKIVKKDIERIITISKNSVGRVKKFYGLDSKIIYPPIETEKYRFREFGEYYFTANRLVPEKRVDLIARAFTRMPEKKLVIAGYGAEEKKIKKIIQGCKNIEFVDRISEKELIEHYSRCLATIYMPVDEDFGMIPLEGNASGKPCIAVNEGGCKETILQGKTGFLVEPKEEEIIKTVKGLNAKKVEEMKSACINWAKKFDKKYYLEKWKKEIKEAVKEKK